MVEGKQRHIVYFLVSGGQKIASGLLTFPSLGMENSALSTQISVRTDGKQRLHTLLFRPWRMENSLTFAYFFVRRGRKITLCLVAIHVIWICKFCYEILRQKLYE